MKRRRVRWQIKLIIALVMILIGVHAQMQTKYDIGRADQAYEEAMK
jgi:hypothetical protein